MEHKAFIFDFAEFEFELRPMLERALVSGRCEELKEFIEKNRSTLTDPYEGAPLGGDWEDLLEVRDVDTYADFCLTRYYNPTEDHGFGSQWEDVMEAITRNALPGVEIVLGTPIHANGVYFDPGKMGSYFSSCAEVRERTGDIGKILESTVEGVRELELVRFLYLKAMKRKEGLYVTF